MRQRSTTHSLLHLSAAEKRPCTRCRHAKSSEFDYNRVAFTAQAQSKVAAVSTKTNSGHSPESPRAITLKWVCSEYASSKQFADKNCRLTGALHAGFGPAVAGVQSVGRAHSDSGTQVSARHQRTDETDPTGFGCGGKFRRTRSGGSEERAPGTKQAAATSCS